MVTNLFVGKVADGIQQCKKDIPVSVQQALTAVFYIGDTGLDGKQACHIAGTPQNIMVILVNAGSQVPAIRAMILEAAEHLK